MLVICRTLVEIQYNKQREAFGVKIVWGSDSILCRIKGICLGQTNRGGDKGNKDVAADVVFLSVGLTLKCVLISKL